MFYSLPGTIFFSLTALAFHTPELSTEVLYLPAVSDYIDYNVDDSYHEPSYSYAAPVHSYAASGPSYAASGPSYAASGHSYGGGGHQQSYGQQGHSYGHTDYYTTYQAVPVPVYDDEEEESFGTKLAKGWKDAKDTVRKWEEEATKKIKDFCKYMEKDCHLLYLLRVLL